MEHETCVCLGDQSYSNLFYAEYPTSTEVDIVIVLLRITGYSTSRRDNY